MSNQAKSSTKGGVVGGVRCSIFYGNRLDRTVILAQDCIFIGRLLTSHLPVEDPKVSRMHAVIEIREGKSVVLTDLESSNGTRVNGQEETVIDLKDGDVVEVGDSRIKVEFVTPDEVAANPSIVHHSGISRGIGQQVGVDTVMLEAGAVDAVAVSSEEIDGIIDSLEPSLGDKQKKADATTQMATAADQQKVATKKPSSRKITGLRNAFEVKVQWGEELLDVMHLDQPRTICVGQDRRNTFIVPPMEAYPSSVPIISPVKDSGSGAVKLGFTSNMEGWVYTGDKLRSLDDLRKMPRTETVRVGNGSVYEFPLGPSDKGMVAVENLAFCFQTVRALPPYKAPKTKKDRRPLFWGLALYLFLLLFLLLFPVPEKEPTVAEQVEETVSAVEVLYNRGRAQDLLEKLVSPELKDIGSMTGTKTGKAVVGTQTKGKKTDDRRAGGKSGQKTKAVGPKVPSRKPSPSSQSGEKLAKALNALKSDDLTRLLGKSGFTGKGGGLGTTSKPSKHASAPRVFQNLGSVLKDAGSGSGEGGLGSGGGKSVDIGGVGTKGRGSGAEGYGTVRLGRKQEALVALAGDDDVEVRGQLDKALVRRIVERNKQQLSFCYDTKLNLSQRKGRRSGRVAVNWRIAPSGRVVKTTLLSSTMNDAQFERCILDRIRTWVFPEPKGGGYVNVEWPFTFSVPG